MPKARRTKAIANKKTEEERLTSALQHGQSKKCRSVLKQQYL